MRNLAYAIHDFVTFKISRVLEPLLDEIEYRLAKYRLAHKSKPAERLSVHATRASVQQS